MSRHKTVIALELAISGRAPVCDAGMPIPNQARRIIDPLLSGLQQSLDVLGAIAEDVVIERAVVG